MDKTRKKRIKRTISWLCMALVVLGLTVMPLMAKTEAEADGPQASVLSAQAQMGSIGIALRGGGTLQAQDQQQVNIPTGVKITEFLVQNGQTVTAGTPVAQVDKVSVMTAITQVSQSMEFIREELENARDEAVDGNIRATAGGRVKKLYAQQGQSVQEVMLREGCLAVLSLDGLMAVRLEVRSSLATGEDVTVTLSDGTAVTGRVESNLDGVVTVTVEDGGYADGEPVTVEGLGSGRLYIHNAWRATGYSGTVSRVHTQEEKTLTSGAILFTLTDTDYEGQLRHRANQHREYEQLLQTLLKMHESGTIDAPCDGIVSGIDSASPNLLSAEPEQAGYSIQFLASVTYKCTEDKNCEAEPEDHETGCPMICEEKADCEARKHTKDCIKSCTHADIPQDCASRVHYDDCIHSCAEAQSCTASKHSLNCIHSCVHADELGKCPSAVHFGDCISGCTGDGDCKSQKHTFACVANCIQSSSPEQICPALNHKDGCTYAGVTYTAMAAKVQESAVQEGKLLVYMDVISRYTAEKADTPSGWQLSPQLNRENFLYQMDLPVADPGSYSHGDIVLIINASRETIPQQVVLYEEADDQGGQGGSPGVPGFPGGGIDWGGILGGFSGMGGSFGGYAGSYGGYEGMLNQPQDEGLYDLEGSTLLTVTPVNTMVLNITLDEQDIAKVSLGMEAQVKVEALRGQIFLASVTKVGTIGKNMGGSSKFTVELTLAAHSDMLSGMSATAQLPLERRDQILTVPVAALDTLGARTVVYTAQDPDSGDPCDPREVVTGISDGEYVQILSGLAEGDTVCYWYYDTLELDTSAEAKRFTFG